MNDEFACDIGDYGKYGLLRVLKQVGGFQLGIAWMKTKTKTGTSSKLPHTFDSLDTSKKKNESLATCDPELYQILKSLVDDNKWTIADIQESGALPAGTIYFDKLLDFGGMPAVGKKAMNDRLAFRSDWFERALNCLQGTKLVFFDPDTGIEIPSMKRHRADG